MEVRVQCMGSYMRVGNAGHGACRQIGGVVWWGNLKVVATGERGGGGGWEG